MRWISGLALLCALLNGGALSHAKSRPLMAWSAALNIIALSVQERVSLYDGGTQQLLAVLEGKSTLTALAWQPAGDLLAMGDADGWLCLWSAAEFTRQCRSLEGSAIRALAWHPSGASLASASGDRVHLWQVEGLALSQVWSAEGLVTALAWQADQLAVGGALQGTYEQGFLALYNQFGTAQQRYTAEMRPPLSLQSLADDRLAVGTPFDVFVWSTQTQHYLPLYLPLSEGEAVRVAAWRPDGVRALVVLDRRLLCFAEGALAGEHTLDMPAAALTWTGFSNAALLTEDGSLRFVEVPGCQ